MHNKLTIRSEQATPPPRCSWKYESTKRFEKHKPLHYIALLDLQSCNVVKLVCAGGPDPSSLLATTEQE